MRLCVDVGNTTIGMGVYENDTLVYRFRFASDKNKTEDEFFAKLKTIFPNEYISNIDFIMYSSVVPLIDTPLKAALSRLLNAQIISLGMGIKTGLRMNVEHPQEVGSDLIADLVGAKEKYGYPTIIADLGTASKVLVIDKEGTFSTCVIMPGIESSKSSLAEKAALLTDVALEKPVPILKCRNTKTAMLAGIVYGHADSVNGILSRYEEALGYKCKRILTGGAGNLLKDYIKADIYDETLCLDGLNIILNKQK